MLQNIMQVLFYGACFFLAAETAGTRQRVARVCPFFFREPQKSAGMLSGGEGEEPGTDLLQ